MKSFDFAQPILDLPSKAAVAGIRNRTTANELMAKSTAELANPSLYIGKSQLARCIGWACKNWHTANQQMAVRDTSLRLAHKQV